MYQHIVQYYETDKMGITHHSNYIRWMEEASSEHCFLNEQGVAVRLRKEYPLFYSALTECCHGSE